MQIYYDVWHRTNQLHSLENLYFAVIIFVLLPFMFKWKWFLFPFTRRLLNFRILIEWCIFVILTQSCARILKIYLLDACTELKSISFEKFFVFIFDPLHDQNFIQQKDILQRRKKQFGEEINEYYSFRTWAIRSENYEDFFFWLKIVFHRSFSQHRAVEM